MGLKGASLCQRLPHALRLQPLTDPSRQGREPHKRKEEGGNKGSATLFFKSHPVSTCQTNLFRAGSIKALEPLGQLPPSLTLRLEGSVTCCFLHLTRGHLSTLRGTSQETSHSLWLGSYLGLVLGQCWFENFQRCL